MRKNVFLILEYVKNRSKFMDHSNTCRLLKSKESAIFCYNFYPKTICVGRVELKKFMDLVVNEKAV